MLRATHGHVFMFGLLRTKGEGDTSPPMNLPTNTHVDKRLLLGAALFGAGWGIGGFCPGPAVVAAASLATDGLIFIAAMLAGMFVFSVRNR